MGPCTCVVTCTLMGAHVFITSSLRLWQATEGGELYYKTRKLIPATASKSILKSPSPCIKTNNLPAARESLNNATHRTSPTNISPQDKHGGSLLTHANATESENGGDTENEQQWTKVSHKRRKVRLPPCWKLRVPQGAPEGQASNT